MTRYFSTITKLDAALLAFVLLVVSFFVTSASGQSTFGDVVGVVKDPGQGLVGAAQVVLTSIEE
jgi:hypothetical protein